MSGTLYIVATPIGNLEDITARALRILREAALIAAEDTRRTGHLLARYAVTTPTTSLHAHNETGKTSSLIARLQSGDSIALVSDAGTPTISDPGLHLIRAAIAARIRVEAIPGPSAIVAALAASGFDTQPFTFLGFPPTRGKDRRNWLALLQAATMTVVFFEAPHRIRRTLQDIAALVGDVPVAIARELTKAHEILVRGPISEVMRDKNLELGELTIVVDLRRPADEQPRTPMRDTDLADELGLMANNDATSRRTAIHKLANKYGVRPNEIYKALERAKQLVK